MMQRSFQLSKRWAAVSRAFIVDDGAALLVPTAFVLLVAVGIATISIDGSKYFYLRRVQQSATDIAAISAASDMSNASTLAVTSTGTNRFAASAISNVELGTYMSDPNIPAAQRFTPSNVSPTAVRVTLATQPPFIFGGLLDTILSGAASAQTGFQIQTRAVAVNQNVASFSLASGLAQVNGGVENAIMSALLGSEVSLGVMDWQALASANVDLFAFASALNTRAQIKAVTYGSVANATVTRTQALQAIGDALSASGASTSAITALKSFVAAGGLSSPTIRVASLVSFGPFGNTLLTANTPVTAKVTAFDLLSAIVQMANGRNEVQTDLSLGLPGVASLHLSLVIGDPPASSGLIAIGATGTTLHTAQTRLSLAVRLIGSGLTPAVNLPLYVELASGTAQLSAVTCSNTASQATLSVMPGVVDGWIGTISDADLTNLGGTPSIGDATLFSLLGLATVTGHAHATIANANPTAVSFSQGDIAAVAAKSTSTTDFAASLYSSLLSNLSLKVNVVGAGFGVPTGLDTSVRLVLSGAATSVDQSLNIILSALGLSLGNATTSVSGVKCGRSTLVN